MVFAKRSESDASAYAAYIEPGRYLVKCVRVEDGGPSKKFQHKDGTPKQRVKWVFHVAIVNGEARIPIRDEKGDIWEMFQFTSDSTHPKAAHYPWLVALLGREPEPDEGPQLAPVLAGKFAWALITRKTVKLDGVDRTYINIVDMSPFKAGEQPPVWEPPTELPAGTAETSDLDEVPF